MKTIPLTAWTIAAAALVAAIMVLVTVALTLTLTPEPQAEIGEFDTELRTCGQLFKPGTDSIAICMGAVTWKYHQDAVTGTP